MTLSIMSCPPSLSGNVGLDTAKLQIIFVNRKFFVMNFFVASKKVSAIFLLLTRKQHTPAKAH